MVHDASGCILQDGATTSDDDRLLVIGATNRPQEIDEAARRRLVKRLYIPLPDSEARKQIVSNLMKQQPFSLSEEEMEELCQRSEGQGFLFHIEKFCLVVWSDKSHHLRREKYSLDLVQYNKKKSWVWILAGTFSKDNTSLPSTLFQHRPLGEEICSHLWEPKHTLLYFKWLSLSHFVLTTCRILWCWHGQPVSWSCLWTCQRGSRKHTAYCSRWGTYTWHCIISTFILHTTLHVTLLMIHVHYYGA